MNNFLTFIETVAYIATSLSVVIGFITLCFEFYKYKQNQKQKRMFEKIKMLLSLIDIIQKQKDFINYKLIPVYILKSIQINHLDNITKILTDEKYNNNANRIICNQLLHSNNKYILPHRYENYQRRNIKIYNYMLVNYKKNPDIYDLLHKLYFDIQHLEDSIDKKIIDLSPNQIFQFVKNNTNVIEEKDQCKIDFEKTINRIQIDFFQAEENQKRNLCSNCDDIIKKIKNQLKDCEKISVKTKTAIINDI